MNNIKERLTEYIKEKHLTLTEKAIDKMINYSKS